MSVDFLEHTPDEKTPLLRRSSHHSISIELVSKQDFKAESYYKVSEDEVTVIPIKALKKTIKVLEPIVRRSLLEQVDDFLVDFLGHNSKKIYFFGTLLMTYYFVSKIQQSGRDSLRRWNTSLSPGDNISCAVTYKKQASCTILYNPKNDSDPHLQYSGIPPNDLFCFNLLVALCTAEGCGQLLSAQLDEAVFADDCTGPTSKTTIIYGLAYVWILPAVQYYIITPIFNCFFGTYAQRTQNRQERRRTQFFTQEPTLLEEVQMQQYFNSHVGEILKEAKQALNSTAFFSQRHEIIKEFFPEAGTSDDHIASIVDKYLGVCIKK